MESLVDRKKLEGKFHGAEEIRNFNETKQYTLMATGVLESLVTDPNLTASAAKLWDYLYTKAIMNEKLCIRIKYKDLAQKFNRAERTIKRYVENLKDHGYLDVESNYYNHGQKANTYYLKLPRNIIEGMQNTKDRKQIARVDIDGTSSDSSIAKDRNILMNEITAEIQEGSEVKSEHIELLQSDKSVTLDHDITVTPNNNIKKIILNNNVVVFSSQNDLNPLIDFTKIEMTAKQEENIVLRETKQDLPDTQDQEKINKLESEISSLFIKMGQVAGTEKIAIFDQIRQLQGTVSSISVIMRQREQAKLIPFKTNEGENNAHFVDPSTDFSKTTGERELSIIEITRIKKAVEKIPNYLNDSRRICNEIAYAVRFGALRIAQSGNTLSVPHAISIAVKLLREGRWETPTPMKKKEKQPVSQDINHHLWVPPQSHQHVRSLLQNMNTCGV
jgi:hypothetical protein